MAERYWEAEEAPDVLLDWASNTVAEAMQYFWEDDKPVAWINPDFAETKGRIVLIIGGPPKPTVEYPDGSIDIYTLDVDLLDELREFSQPYAFMGGPRGDSQRKDMRERAAALRKLAEEIAGLAAHAAEAG